MWYILVTLSALLNDDFANDNSSMLYYHEMIIILLHVVTAQNVLSIFLELALKSLSEQYFGDRMMTKYNLKLYQGISTWRIIKII